MYAPALAALLLAAPPHPAPVKQAPPSLIQLDEDRAYAVGREAFTFGFPLVVTDVARTQRTHVAQPSGPRGAPVNQFAQLTEVPSAKSDAVLMPNADTLSSAAFVDVEKEPIVLTVPQLEDRWFLVSILDAWTNVLAAPGVRTTGTVGGDYALVAPGWKGTLPATVLPVRVPTRTLWITARILFKGRADLDAARAAQAGLRLTPLSAWGKPYKAPAVPVKDAVPTTAPNEQVRDMGARFFVRLADTMTQGNLPAPEDLALLRRLAKLSLVAGQPFPLDSFHGPVRSALERAVQDGWKDLTSSASAGRLVNGWRLPEAHVGDYGTDYALRARTAFATLGANLLEDVFAPRVAADSESAPLDGAKHYILHFGKDALPPVNGFWSLTAYDARNLFVDNPLDRYRLGDRDDLKRNADGSLDLYVGATSPGAERESNWLPVPAQGPFSLVLRLYGPKPTALDGTWKPPSLLRAQ